MRAPREKFTVKKSTQLTDELFDFPTAKNYELPKSFVYCVNIEIKLNTRHATRIIDVYSSIDVRKKCSSR